MSERVLVTGASGFVGTALVAALLRAGSPVRAATRAPDSAVRCQACRGRGAPRSQWDGRLGAAAGRASERSCTSPASPMSDRASTRPSTIASIISRRRSWRAACARAGVRRLVFVSSVRAQSGAAASHVLKETDAPRPSEAYGRSKLQAEEAVRASGVRVDDPAARDGLRPRREGQPRRASCGLPRRRGRCRSRASPTGARSSASTISLRRSRSRSALRRCAGETYLVADPEPVTFAEILTALARAAPGKPRGSFRCLRPCSRRA